jgi:hypothetical protein
MVMTLSGGGPGDRDWRDFPAGSPLYTDDWEADDLVRIGLAVEDPEAGGGAGTAQPPAPEAEAPGISEPVRSGAPLPPEPSPAPVAPPEVSPVAEVSGVAEVAAVPPSDADVIERTQAPPAAAEPPQPSDIKQRWIDYAIAMGEDPGVAPNMTKADLMSKYGGRL